MRIQKALVALALAAMMTTLLADDRHIDFDHHTEFSALKTFAVQG